MMCVRSVTAMKLKNKICPDIFCAMGIGLSIGTLVGLTITCITLT